MYYKAMYSFVRYKKINYFILKIISKIFKVKIIIWRKSYDYQKLEYETYEIKESENHNERFIHLLEENFIIKGFIEPNLATEIKLNDIDLYIKNSNMQVNDYL